MIEWLLSQLQQPLLGYGQFSSVLGYPKQAPLLGIRSAGGELPLSGKGPVMDLPAPAPQNLGEDPLVTPGVTPTSTNLVGPTGTQPVPGVAMPTSGTGGVAGGAGPVATGVPGTGGVGGGAGAVPGTGGVAVAEPVGYGEGLVPSQLTGYGAAGLVGGIASLENVQPRGFRGGKGPVARLEDLAGRPPRGNWLVR